MYHEVTWAASAVLHREDNIHRGVIRRLYTLRVQGLIMFTATSR